jgi:hypothetical protein
MRITKLTTEPQSHREEFHHKGTKTQRKHKEDFMGRAVLSILFSLFVCTISADFIIQDDLTKIFNTSKGENITGSISIFNPMNTAIVVMVSQADYVYNARDEYYYIEPGKYERSNANWIKFGNTISVQPNQKAIFNFSISTPSEKELSGSYWSVLFFEEEGAISTRDNIEFGFRYAVQIVNNINNTGSVDLSFLDVNYDNQQLSLILKNTGNLWLNAEIKIDIFDEYAKFIGSFVSEKNRIYPELNRRIQIPLTHLNYSNYYAVIIADCGDNKIFGHQMSFTVR